MAKRGAPDNSAVKIVPVNQHHIESSKRILANLGQDELPISVAIPALNDGSQFEIEVIFACIYAHTQHLFLAHGVVQGDMPEQLELADWFTVSHKGTLRSIAHFELHDDALSAMCDLERQANWNRPARDVVNDRDSRCKVTTICASWNALTFARTSARTQRQTEYQDWLQGRYE